MKNKLPKNWIVVPSASHPDKVYYFNVKTNKSSWNEPKEEPVRTPRRRNRSSDENNLPKSSDANTNMIESDTNSTRKKLHAKRMSHPAVLSETPQMRMLREKLLERRLKTVAKTETKTRESNVKSQNLLENTKDIKDASAIPKKVVPSPEADTSTKKTFTPEMQAIYDRIQQKKLNASTSKKGKTKDIVESSSKIEKNQATLLRRPKTRSSSMQDNTVGSSVSESASTSTSIIDHSRKSEEQVKAGASKAIASIPERRRTVNKRIISGSCETARKPPEKTPLKPVISPIKTGVKRKRNLANERMKNLRDSLGSENEEAENHVREKRLCRNSTRTSVAAEQPMEFDPDVSVPNVYENSEIRYRRLQVRLSKLAALQNSNNTNNSGNSQDNTLNSLPRNPTVEKLVKQCVTEQEDEEMDWEPIENEKITHEVQAVRMQLCSDGLQRPINSVPEDILTVPVETPEKDKKLYIIIDTNVFLSNIEVVEETKDAKFQTYGYPFIMIPWTVICELDYIKNNKSTNKSEILQAKARKAIRLINRYFSSRHPRIVGQKPEDVKKNKEKFDTSCPDDEILQTCLQIREKGNPVVLLSYDTNLCNKAMIYDITTLGHGDPLEKIDYLHASERNKDRSTANASTLDLELEDRHAQISTLEEELVLADEIFLDLKTVMKDFLSEIVAKELENLFGKNWEKHTPIKPPWTLITVLKCAIKHWIAAVSESFVRKAEPVLKELLQAFICFPDNGGKLKDVAAILERCGDLVQMVFIDKHPDLMTTTSNKIDELAERCLQYEKRIVQRRLKTELGVEESVEEQNRRAEKAFHCFELTYAYARDMGGLAAEIVQMPCSFLYKKIEPLPSVEYVKKTQPDIAANVNRLLHALSAGLEQVNNSCIDTRTLNKLYQALTMFSSDVPAMEDMDLSLTDVYCCLIRKTEVLKAGMNQLQDLSTHFCRLATYRCT